jgi:hypothetical protein
MSRAARPLFDAIFRVCDAFEAMFDGIHEITDRDSVEDHAVYPFLAEESRAPA